ncbi:MAG: hypothetical protein FJX03_01285 [Alphaproteobacteria bacterium]|nr:hypothetical protein [Alphaproteobacteria bacterium]
MKFTTLLKCGLLATCLSEYTLAAQNLTYSPFSLSQEQSTKMIQSHHPEEFGVNKIDQGVIKGHRANLEQYNGKVPEDFYASHDPAIAPLFAKFEAYLKQYAHSNPHHIFTRRLLREMTYQKEDQHISPLWLLGMHLRFAASISTITDDERSLFSHVPFPNLFFGITENDAWKNSLSTYVSLEGYPNKGFELPDMHWSVKLKAPMIDLFADRTKKLLPSPILYPLPGEGKLGVSLMVESNLNDVYPACFPTTTNKGHGINFSQFGFGIHDMLHKYADRRHYNVVEHVLRRAEVHANNNGNTWKFAEIYPPVAAQRYRVIMSGLKSIYTDMVTKLLPRDGKTAFNRAMVGFFWSLHEAPNFTPHLYNMNDFGKVLKTITASSHHNTVAVATDNLDSWESSYDPFATSPIDGTTKLTDAEILDHPVIKSLTIDQAQGHKYGFQYYPSPLLTTVYSDDSIVSKTVIRNSRFIDVVFNMLDGEELVYSFPTLFHKWTNLDDNLGLLQYGGTNLTKPILPSDESQRDTARLIAQDLLERVKLQISDHVKHFHDVASFFSKDDSRGSKRSLENRFFYTHFNQEQMVENALKPIPPVAPSAPPVPAPVFVIRHSNGDKEIQFPNGDIEMQFADQSGQTNFGTTTGAVL